jgi:hypothetical protein
LVVEKNGLILVLTLLLTIKVMNTHENYTLALLHLTYLLIWSDSEISGEEIYYLDKIKESEGISDAEFEQFNNSVIGKTGLEIYQSGIKMINACSSELKIRAFVKLFQLANAVFYCTRLNWLILILKTSWLR